MSITVALYSHDSVGLGHARRNRALAYALAAELPRLTGQRVRGLLIAGHPDATADSLPEGWDWLVLPGFTHTRHGYACRSLDVRPSGCGTCAAPPPPRRWKRWTQTCSSWTGMPSASMMSCFQP